MEDLEDIDEEEVEKIFKRIGFMEKEKHEEETIKLFDGIHCKTSMYLLS
jgi:hypothetical protein